MKCMESYYVWVKVYFWGRNALETKCGQEGSLQKMTLAHHPLAHDQNTCCGSVTRDLMHM